MDTQKDRKICPTSTMPVQQIRSTTWEPAEKRQNMGTGATMGLSSTQGGGSLFQFPGVYSAEWLHNTENTEYDHLFYQN
jgi:hypothetical protein